MTGQRLIRMLALLLAWGSATSDVSPLLAQRAEPDSLTRVALEAALETFNAAFLSADAKGLDTLLVTDYLHTNGGTGAVLDKTGWLEYIRHRRAELQSGRLQVERHESAGVTIRWYPDAAVVNSQVISQGKRDGEPFLTRLRVTQVWVLTDHGWRRAAFHDSPIPGS